MKLKTQLSFIALVAAGAMILSACEQEPVESDVTMANEDVVATVSSCEDLSSLQIEYTTISSASPVAAGAFEPPAAPGARPANYASLPDFCRVTGSIKPTPQSDIQFEAWLPVDGSWNGDFMQVGNGGAAGSIIYASMVEPLKRGYAVVNTDTGHKGTAGDFSWALGEPEKLEDYQYRAVRELTLKGKEITEARYGKAPETSVWFGCSTGGRQGLLEAQRYPEDYDLVIAGAPANNWVPLQLTSINYLNKLGDAGLPVSKLGVLKAGAIAACDADDGLADGVISDIAACDFDPASLVCDAGADEATCFTEAEAEAARYLYEGLIKSDGEKVFPGTGFGSETDWAAYVTPFFRIGTSWVQNVTLADPNWDPMTFDLDREYAAVEAQDQGVTTAMDPNLKPFIDAGGKLLLYHGTTDGIIPYGNTVKYYESVVSTLGEDATDENVQFFLVPGMGHCSGGDGASVIDWIGAIEAWDETGEKPVQLSAMKPGDGGFTRPICEYPQVVTYSGEGDPSDAASFVCSAE